MPRRDVADGDDTQRVKRSADQQSHGNRAHVTGALKFWIGFFGALGRGLKAGEEIWNDLQRQHDGDKRAGAKQRLKIRGSAAPGADAEERDEENQHRRRGPVLEVGAEADAAIVQHGEKCGRDDAEQQTRKKNGLAGDAVELE